MISRNGVSYGHREHREAALARHLDERRRDALEAEADAEPERAHAVGLELRRRARAGPPALRAQPHAGGQHHPVRAEPARGRVDLDGVRAAHLALRRLRAAAHQLEPERLLGEQVGEMEHGGPSLRLRLGRRSKPRARVSAPRRLSGARGRRRHFCDRTIQEDEMPATADHAPRPRRPAARPTRPPCAEAVAALNAGNPEDYLALFAPDAHAARLPGRHRGRRRPLPLPRRDRRHVPRRVRHARRRRSPRATASRRASRGARARAPAGRSRPAAARSCASPTGRSPSAGTCRPRSTPSPRSPAAAGRVAPVDDEILAAVAAEAPAMTELLAELVAAPTLLGDEAPGQAVMRRAFARPRARAVRRAARPGGARAPPGRRAVRLGRRRQGERARRLAAGRRRRRPLADPQRPHRRRQP